MKTKLYELLRAAGILAALLFAAFALTEIMWIADELGVTM